MADNDWGSEGATGRVGGSASAGDPKWEERIKTPYDDDSKVWKDEYKRNVGESALNKQRERMRKTADEETAKYEKKPAAKAETPKPADKPAAKPAAGKPASDDAAKAAARRKRLASGKRNLAAIKSKKGDIATESNTSASEIGEKPKDQESYKAEAKPLRETKAATAKAEGPAKKKSLFRRVAGGVGRGLKATGRGVKRALADSPQTKKTTSTAKNDTGKRGYEGKWA
jgi:hypothetical protein